GCQPQKEVSKPETTQEIQNTPSKEILSKDKYWKFKIKYEPKPNEEKISLYNAPGFEGKGELARKWTTTLEELKAWHIGAYPQSWQFDRSIIDPKTGNIIQHNTPPAGKTDGKYVYGLDYHQCLLPLDCWELDNYKHLWDGPQALAGDHHVFTIKGALLHASQPFQSLIYRLDPETGETLWQLSADFSGSVTWCPTENYLAVSVDFYRVEGSLKKELIETYIYLVDPITGQNKNMKLSHNNVISMACVGNNLWIQTVDAHLLCVDLTTMKETKDIKINHSLANKLNNWSYPLERIGNKLLLSLYSEFSKDSPSEVEYILFDTLSGRQTVLSKPAPETSNYIPKVSIINGSLIYQDSPTQLRGVDPDTLETLWWIDKKNLGENAHVAWLDWRGVCVISDTKIMCFGPK
ncbi:MAG: hypothetical protein GYA78_00680, partial [Caldisericales bacterium]|nr:hypothetical protein [Caldisericales bacterium]